MTHTVIFFLSTYRLMLSVALVGVVGAGCTSTASLSPSRTEARGALGSEARLGGVSSSQRLEAWRDAESISASGPGRTTVVGAGESMAPVYGEGTVLVLTQIPFERLRAGMNVAYLNQDGRRVVHRLREETFGGWQLQGLNNGFVDREKVTPKNFLGVVYASLDASVLAAQ